MQMTETQRQVFGELVNSLKDRIARAKLVLDAGHFAVGFYLINKSENMVVINAGDTFRLNACDVTNGYRFPWRSKAQGAASRWNEALNAEQRKAGCEVHEVTARIYLETLVNNCEKLLATFETALEEGKED